MEEFRKITPLIILLLGLTALSLKSWGAFLTPGKPAPNFLVESGNNQKLSLDMIRGRVIVLFYESRHEIRKNIELKNELKGLYRAQPEDIKQEIFRLVVIDCSTAVWPTTPIWKSKLNEHSRKEGFTIYGDWSGKMLVDYHMKADDSNFLIIDKRGFIRYVATGRISHDQFEKIKEFLHTLAREE